MSALEWRVAASLAAIYAVRMLGLFMILPVFTLYAHQLPDVQTELIGLAIGIYGLTQALLQIPLGIASDRFGRKPVILFGLSIFLLGSIVAALNVDNIIGIIIGRFLQGMGAIAAVTMALAADLSREEYRARVMGVIGMSIALAFALAMVLGPLLHQLWGMAGIFWSTATLTLLAMLILVSLVPTPPQTFMHRDAGIVRNVLGKVFSDPQLLRMDAGVFVLHLIMTANFIALPSLFETQLQLEATQHWQMYLPVLLISFLVSVPMIILAEKKRKIKALLLIAIGLLIIAEAALALYAISPWLLQLGFVLFFIGFNFLEAVQPSLIAKYAAVTMKGTAMGVFTSAQFMGIFVGGALGGIIEAAWGYHGIFWFSAALALLWWLMILGLPTPKFYRNRVVRLHPEQLLKYNSQQLQQLLYNIPGIKESFIDFDKGTAYLKIDTQEFQEEALKAYTA